jgi:hypothetical protein
MNWWYCLKHLAVEHGPGCANEARLGPYESQALAQAAVTRMQERTHEQDALDE